MSELLPLFLVGLMGGTHCFGMCGGIVGALAGPRWSLLVAYNGGRIASYVGAGAIAGGLAGLAASAGGDGREALEVAAALPLRLGLLVLANVMLLAMGLYLMGLPQLLLPLERGGGAFWRRLQPLGRRFFPARGVRQAFPLGLIWGWLPCGLVYSALATALASGSALRGGAAMLAFGLGTLPNLLLAGVFAARLGPLVRKPMVRVVAGSVVLGFGLWGLLSAWRMARATGFI